MVHGGKRKGAGRPIKTGQYGEPTKPMRLPVSMLDDVNRFIAHKGYKIPLYSSSISAGFPSPADDYIERSLDLNEYLIQHPAATFFVRATGESMIDAGIFENDILIVDKSLTPKSGKIVIAAIDGHLTVKRLKQSTSGELELNPDNPKFNSIKINENSEVHIWGVVTSVIHLV